MTLQSQYNQIVTIETPTTAVASVDEYRKATYETDIALVRCLLNMESSSEEEQDRNTITNAWTMLCDPDVNITALSTVRWSDAVGTVHHARVIGKPMMKMLRAQLHHLEIQLAEILDALETETSS